MSGWVSCVSTLLLDVPSVLKCLVAVSGWVSCVSTLVCDVPSVLKFLVLVSECIQPITAEEFLKH